MLETVWNDLRMGARMLAKNPGFACIAILSIALGVGANAAMFSIADGMVLRPLQVARPDDIVAVGANSTADQNAGFVRNRTVSYPDYVELRDRAQSVAGLVGYRVVITSFSGSPDQPAESRLGLAVSGNFFDVLGLRAAVGRTFGPQEDRVPGRDAVLVLAHDTWVDRFGADPQVVGRRVRVGGVDFSVVGVTPESFPGMDLVLHPAFYVPFAMAPRLSGSPPDALENRTVRGITMKGRLEPGVSLQQAQQEIDLIAAALERTYPDTNRGLGFLVRSDFDARIEERGPAAPASFMMLTLAFVVLLVACANVAGLLMSRAPARQRELALRMAVGGTSRRLIRQLVTESALIAAAGAAIGLWLAYVLIEYLGRFQSVSDIGVKTVFRLDQRVLIISLVLAAASAILSSLVPAWRATKSVDLSGSMKATPASGGRRSSLWGRNGLVAVQVALSLIVLTVGVFLYRTFQAEFSRPGFRTDHLLLVNVQHSLARYDAARSDAFYRVLRDRVQALPGVSTVGLTSWMPVNQDYRERTTIVPEGYQFLPGVDNATVFSSRIDQGYLATMRIPILSGRGVQVTDTADTPPVALVNEALAARYWPGQNAVGKRIRLPQRNNQSIEIVGVTANSKYNWLGEPPTPFMYLPVRQDPAPRSTLVIGSEADAAALAEPVRRIIRDIDRDMPISGVRTIEEFYYGSALAAISMLLSVVAGMGGMGVLLAMFGLYGLVSYAASQRTREIGIRMAIGAHPRLMLRMVLGHGVTVAVAGVVLGVAASAATSGLLRALIPTIERIDAATYLLVLPALILVTLLAAYVPARRAARVDPVVALRAE